MSLANYTDLVASASSWLHRADLTSQIPDFITLTESLLWYGSEDPKYPVPTLRIAPMQNVDTGNASSGVIALPTGYLETIRLNVSSNGQTRTLKYKAPADNTPYEIAGNALYYTMVNNGIKVGPLTAAYTHDYFKKLDGLTASNATNWIITNAPNVYLYGVLMQAAPFLGKDAKLDTYYRMFMAAVRGLQNADKDKTKPSGLAVSLG